LFKVAVPPGVVTTKFCAPRDPAGTVKVTDVAELTVRFVAGFPPIVTELALVKFVPVSVSTVPPPVTPEIIDRDVAVGVDVAFAPLVNTVENVVVSSANTKYLESVL
jgi:hypothetical protein